MATHSTRPADAPERNFADVTDLRAEQRERRQRAIDTAAGMMVEIDYDRIQVKEVCEQAGIALGTFYRYFNSKDHLFALALLEWASGFRHRVDRRGDVPTKERVRAVYRRAVRAFERVPRVYATMLNLQSTTDPHAAEVFRQYLENTDEAFGASLAALPAARRDDVVAVMDAVLSTGLTAWQLDRLPIASVYGLIDGAVDLIFDPWSDSEVR